MARRRGTRREAPRPDGERIPHGADAGLFLGYRPDRVDISRRAAAIVARVLKGAKPSDVPFEQPTKLDFVVNLRIAKALGTTVPPSLRRRADRVIESRAGLPASRQEERGD